MNGTTTMKKIVIISLFTFFTLVHAKVLDAIALVVNGEPITTAEIKAIQKQMSLSKKEARELLIQDRIQESVMKNIHVQESMIDQKILQIATQNKLTVQKMQEILLSQGTSWASYRESIKSALKKEKFFRTKASKNPPIPSEDELKIFYSQNKESFALPERILFTEYMATSEKALKRFLETRNSTGIRIEHFNERTDALGTTLSTAILQLPVGAVSSSFALGDRFVSYEVTGHEGVMYMPYDGVKATVLKKWRQKQQTQMLKDYFEKLKTNADIHVIRK